MIKRISAILSLLVYLALLPLSTMNAKGDEPEQKAIFRFPASLKYIEAEAFSDTGAEIIVFPEGFLHLGDNAFSENTHLRNIVLPATTIYIADSAFPITEETLIHGVKGSYVQNWARKHGASFVRDGVWKAILDNGKKTGNCIKQIHDLFHALLALMYFSTVITGQDRDRSRRPQDRPELNPIDYRFP